MNDGTAYCYRVEERLVVPGVLFGTGTGKVFEQRHLYVIIEGGTERYVGQGMQSFTDFWHMRPGDFYRTRDAAELAACIRHNITFCRSLECGWFNSRVCRR